MIRPGFLSVAERIELKACVRLQRENHGVARRANAILLLDDGENCSRIAKFLYLDDDTIRVWYKSCRQDGWDALAFDGWKGSQSRMSQPREAAFALGWNSAFVARPSRSGPISVLNMIWIIPRSRQNPKLFVSDDPEAI
jgi:hypothetical protein